MQKYMMQKTPRNYPPFLLAGVFLISLGALSGFGIMLKFMHDMSGFMGEMTMHMGSMSTDVSAMYDKLSIMTAEVSKVDDVVAHMDSNMNAMNLEINVIQESISRDLINMSKGVDDVSVHLGRLNLSIDMMTATLGHMDSRMSALGYDVHRGTESFSSPMNYMWNMTR
jgi:hypothetical protein